MDVKTNVRALLLGACLLSAGIALGQEGFLVEPWRETPAPFAAAPILATESPSAPATKPARAKGGALERRPLQRTWLVEQGELTPPGFRETSHAKAAPDLFDPWSVSPREESRTPLNPTVTVRDTALLVDPWPDEAAMAKPESPIAEPWLKDSLP